MNRPKLAIWLIFGTALLVLAIAPVIIRCHVSSAKHFSLAVNAEKQGDLVAAFVEFRKASAFFYPFNSNATEALAILERYSNDQTLTPELKTAVLEELVRSYSNIRSWYTSFSGMDGRLEIAKKRLYELRPPKINEPRSELRPAWAMTAQIFFVLWLLAVIGLIVRGFDSEGRVQGRQTLRFSAVALGFFLLYLVALSQA